MPNDVVPTLATFMDMPSVKTGQQCFILFSSFPLLLAFVVGGLGNWSATLCNNVVFEQLLFAHSIPGHSRPRRPHLTRIDTAMHDMGSLGHMLQIGRRPYIIIIYYDYGYLRRYYHFQTLL